MTIFKYTMHILHARLIQEWQDLEITYPEWLTRIVMDELYYTATLVAICIVCFALGLIIGLVATIV